MRQGKSRMHALFCTGFFIQNMDTPYVLQNLYILTSCSAERQRRLQPGATNRVPGGYSQRTHPDCKLPLQDSESHVQATRSAQVALGETYPWPGSWSLRLAACYVRIIDITPPLHHQAGHDGVQSCD